MDRQELHKHLKALEIGYFRAAPPGFRSALKRAREMGEMFAAAFLALPVRDIDAELRKRLEAVAGMAGEHPGVRCALQGACLHAAVFRHLRCKKERDPAGLIAVHAAAAGQGCITQAFMWLERADRDELANAHGPDKAGQDSWNAAVKGAVSAAKVAYALSREGAKVRYPSAQIDVQNKIDLVCGPVKGRTFCLQIKSSHEESSRFIAISEEPRFSCVENRNFKTLHGTWRGVRLFNQKFGLDWTPVFVSVGRDGGGAGCIEWCDSLSKAAGEFLASL